MMVAACLGARPRERYRCLTEKLGIWRRMLPALQPQSQPANAGSAAYEAPPVAS